MSHVFESATSGRAKCRGCGVVIARGELRFGERLPNPFAEGEMTQWFHPACAAHKRPDALLQGLADSSPAVPGREELERVAKRSAAHPRVQRVDGAGRAPSGQAKCRHCHEPIEKGSWRIRVVFYEEGQFAPGGFVHLACRGPYFEGADILEPLLHFSVDLDETARAELQREMEATA